MGAGKSTCINKIIANREWLKKNGLDESLFGSFPLPSKFGFKSVTAFPIYVCWKFGSLEVLVFTMINF